jgi:IS5 family transposase
MRETVSCPAGATVPIVRAGDGSGVAHFGAHCASCPLRSRCTDAARGRNVTIHRHEALLARQRQRGRDPDWLADYRATRPKVERKLAHLIRRGRRARRRGLERVDADWALLAGAVNLARLATLRLHHTPGGWQIAPA